MTDTTHQPDPAVTTLTAKAGDKVDNYTIMEQIGAGGTAVVFRGHDHVLNRDVAIKQLVVPPGEAGEDIRQRALSEAELHRRAAASDPKLLVQFIDTINDPRGLFLISEYVDGPSLEWILQQETGPMEQRQALGIIAATAKALQALHATGMVHRDLKPSNILMPREGGLKLADFGLAAIIAEQQSMDLGSVRYMAPEVLQGQPATPKSDLYSLGIIAYEMLAGRDNFNDAFRTILRDQRNQSMRWVKWHTNARAKVAPLNQQVDAIPESLAELVGRMMEKEPARRVGSAAELLDAIRSHFAAGGQDQPSPSPHAAMAPPKIDDVSQTAEVPRKSKLPIILAATLVLWLVAIGGFFVWKNQQQQLDEQMRTAKLIDAIEYADNLIYEQDYAAARDAFVRIPTEAQFADMFDPNDRRYRDDLIDAGRFKAEALLAAQKDDYITALKKASEYERRIEQWMPQPATPKTTLNATNAEKMVFEYSKRAAFQELAENIEAMLEDGELDDAINEIRRVRDKNTETTASEDIARLNQLEKRYKLLLDDERILALLNKARDLRAAGDLRDAIRELEDEVDRAGDDLDPRVAALLEEMNKLVMIERIEEDIDRAERDNERAELLAALKELRRLQPTQALEARILDLTNAIDIERAEIALEQGKPEKAQQILNDITDRDPENAQAARMLKNIDNARSMVMAVKAGDQHMADGNYAEAVKSYKLSLEYGADTTGQINAKVLDATGRMHIALSEAALDQRDVDEAQKQADLAKSAHGKTDELDDLQRRIDDARSYADLVREGDEWYAKTAFGRAKAKYLAANKIFESEALSEKISNCDFYIWLEQCDAAIATRDWEAAESALKRAEEIKKNEETEARRAKIENRIR